MLQLSYPYTTTGKTMALTIQNFVDKVMSLLLNSLSRSAIAFLLRSKHLLISWLQSPFTVILEPKKKSLLLFPYFPIYLPGSDESRDITLTTKVHLVKAMVFLVVMYGCESWTIQKAEQQRIDAFELWCWRRLLRVPWTARRSNQSILKEISPEYSLEG